MDKIENELLFIYALLEKGRLRKRKNEPFIFSLNNMTHVNKKNYKRDHHFCLFFLHSPFFISSKNYPMVLLFSMLKKGTISFWGDLKVHITNVIV